MKVRIKFSKHGPLRFIGHLDIMRYFQKVFRRADVDISFSGGFSPHPIMSFAMALSVGVESNGEYLDIEMNSPIDMEDLKNTLNASMGEGVCIESCILLPDDAGNAMASVAAAGYYVRIRNGFCPKEGWEKVINGFLAQDKIEVLKKTDKQEFMIDLKDSIYDLRYVPKEEWTQKGEKIGCGDLDDESVENSTVLYLMVNASSSGNIKPVLLLTQLYSFAGEEADPYDFLITRDDLYLNKGTKEEPEFAPLDSIGVEKADEDADHE